MTTCDPSARCRSGLPARAFMPWLAMITPLPVAIEFASCGAPGRPLVAWMSATASGSKAGVLGQVFGIVCVANGASGLNPLAPRLLPPWLEPKPNAPRLVGGGGADSVCTCRVWIEESGMISATEGSARRLETSSADTLAATASGAANWLTPVPPAESIEATTGAGWVCTAAMYWLVCVRRFMPVCCCLSTTMIDPPDAAPPGAGASGPLTPAASAALRPNTARPPPTATATPAPNSRRDDKERDSDRDRSMLVLGSIAQPQVVKTQAVDTRILSHPATRRGSPAPDRKLLLLRNLATEPEVVTVRIYDV